VKNLVFESSELLNNLLALGNCFRVLQLVGSLEDIVDRLGLGRGQSLEVQEIFGGILTRIIGHLFRTESLANDKGSDVMDWAAREVSQSFLANGSGWTNESWYRTPL
jgi:hypothetical protein